MRKLSTFCFVVAILLWAVALFALLIAALGMLLIPMGEGHVTVFDMEGNQWLMPCWILSVVGLAVAGGLRIALKNKEMLNLLPLLLAVAAAVVGLIVALALRTALPAHVGTQYASQGITAWRLIWRHLTPVMAGVFIALSAWLNRLASRNERLRAENDAYKEHYDLSGAPLFSDGDKSTIGLDTYGEEFGIQKPARKLKRSLRHKVAQKK